MAYTKINWENAPSKKTPINDTNLNHMDNGIANNDAEITELKNKISTLEGKVSDIETAIADVPHWETV